MANITMKPDLQGACIAPFLDESKFPAHGGYTAARLCMQVGGPSTPSCCLPCPATEWVYGESFNTYNTVASWLNVFGLILLVFMLVSYSVLPAQKTRSHYLSVCAVLAIGMICIGFIVPLAAQPDKCYNAITPNDMYSSSACAWSGALIVAGGLSVTTWVAIRALSMNLQICWDIVPGRKFFWAAQIFGWGIPAALFAATMTLVGVSFRFGNACHVNHNNSLAVFWGPLMAIAGAAGLLQLLTFAYCIRVYLSSLWGGNSVGMTTAASDPALPTYSSSLRGQTARAVFQRLQKVLWLQWRGLGIVSIILVDVIFLAVVFVYIDGLANDAYKDFNRIRSWVVCLVAHPNDKDQCLYLVSGWLLNQETVVAVLLLLALAGLQCFIMLTRPSFFTAWVEFFQQKFAKRNDFVSLDAQPPTNDMRSTASPDMLRYGRGRGSTTFEMQKPANTFITQSGRSSLDLDTKNMRVDSSQISSPDEAYKSPLHHDRSPSPTWSDRPLAISPIALHPSPIPAATHVSGTQREASDYFGAQERHRTSVSTERQYNPPLRSFSARQTPSRNSSVRSNAYDPRDPYSRSGSRLDPHSEVQDDR